MVTENLDRSFVRSLVWACVRSFVCLLVRALVCSFARAGVRAFVRSFARSCGRAFARSIHSLARWLLLTLRGLSTPNKLKQNGSEYPPSQNWSEHQIK